MVDYNYDGNCDYKDTSFYHNVVEKGEIVKSNESKKKNNFYIKGRKAQNQTTSQEPKISAGATWFIALMLLYFIIKILI
ncbi:MAG: hypothetical protein IJW26_04685 [Clostridia bacterium]|nr:hypothetical protein [Clostridia bacterium]